VSPSANRVSDDRGESRRARVLVVEDSAVILSLIVDALSFEGYQTLGTLDAAEAARLVAAEPFDVIVSDLVMPGISGLSLLDTAKRHRPKTPVILVSGFATNADVADATRRGAFRVLRKPFPPRILLDVVLEALQTRR
jgi:DNA-binding NtrC family response regulator